MFIRKLKYLQIYFERYYTINIRDLLKNIDEVIEKEDFENIIKELDSDLCSKFPKQKIELLIFFLPETIKDFKIGFEI